jgi:hypothetical protein
MIEMLSQWRAGEVIGLAAVVLGCLTAIVWGIALFWCLTRRSEIHANAVREYLQRGLSVDEIERLIRAHHSPMARDVTDERTLEANLASVLVQHEVSAATMEQVVRVFQSADAATKKAVYDAIEEMLESDVSEDQLLAAVRTLCGPRGQSPPVLVTG